MMSILYTLCLLKVDQSKGELLEGVIFHELQQPVLQYPPLLCKHDLDSAHICTEAGMQTVILTHSLACLHVLNTLTQSWHIREQSAGAVAATN